MRKHYPSDVSRPRFEVVRALLEGTKKRTRPRKVDLYDVFCAVLYLLKSGCQWRMLPSDFPQWTTVYRYFQQWNVKPSGNDPSLLEMALKKSGWRGPATTGAQQHDAVLHPRRAKRQEYGHRAQQGI